MIVDAASSRGDTLHGMNTTPLPVETRAILNAAYRVGAALGRKFEASDMTFELRQAAHIFADTYECRPEGDDFMRDMVAKVAYHQGLTDGQAKGVLNVLMADARRRLAARAPQAPAATPAAPTAPARALLANVPDGRYRVTLADGDHLALFVKTAKDDSSFTGKRIVSTRTGGDEWMGVGVLDQLGSFHVWRSCTGSLRDRVRAAVNVLDAAKTEDEWLVAGLAFAQEGSQCFICGRPLDTPESLTAGYGPICAAKHDLPWGDKAVPMSVRLAQATPQALEPETSCVDQVPPSAHTDDDGCDRRRPAAPTSIHREDPATAHYARQQQTLAQAQLEGRARTYTEIFGDDD